MYNPNKNEVPNDIVSYEGELFLVTKFNQKTFKATSLKTGKPWGMSYFVADFVRKATNADRAIQVELVDSALCLGSVVKFQSNLFTVLAISSTGALRLAKLGGDKDRYYKSINPKLVQKVELSDILK